MPLLLRDPVEKAREYVGWVVEVGGQNKGIRVGAIQLWGGGSSGDSWCVEFVVFILDNCYGGDLPIPRQGSAETLRQFCISKGWMVTDPQPGDLCFSVLNDHAHHIGIVSKIGPLTTIAGNTSKDGASSNGDGVYEHAVMPSDKQFARLPRT